MQEKRIGHVVSDTRSLHPVSMERISHSRDAHAVILTSPARTGKGTLGERERETWEVLSPREEDYDGNTNYGETGNRKYRTSLLW